MSRKERREKERAINKSLKRQLTKSQFEELKDKGIEISIQKEVSERIKHFQDTYVDVMIDTLRANRISEERARKIVYEIFSKSIEKATKMRT